MTHRLYLGGQVSGLTFAEADGWRQDIRALFPPSVELVNPLRGNEYLIDHGVLGPGHDDEYLKLVMTTAKAITYRDRHDVRTSDMVLMNLLGMKRASIGCMIELGWADAFGVPVVIVMEEGNPHEHAMVTTIAGWIVDSLEEAAFVVRTVLGGEAL